MSVCPLNVSSIPCRAAFPDVLEKILPADGSTSVGSLFLSILKDMDKLQNFQVYLEGSRVPLELTVDTSVLVGQRVVVKYLPGPCTLFVLFCYTTLSGMDTVNRNSIWLSLLVVNVQTLF